MLQFGKLEAAILYESFEHFANNLWSHCAWHITLFLV